MRHGCRHRQREAIAVAADMPQEIPLVDNAHHLAVLQHRQLGDVIQTHARQDGGKRVVRGRGDGGTFVVAQGDVVGEIAGLRTRDEPLLSHPVVVEHLREIFIAAVAGEGHHPLRRGLRLAILQRGRQQRTAGGARQNALRFQQLARGGEGFAVGDAPGAIHPFNVGQRRNKVFANSLNQPGARVVVASGFHLVGENGSGRVSQDKFRVRRVLGEPRLQAAQRAA